MNPTFSYTYSIHYVALFVLLFLLFLWENRIRKSNGDIKTIRYICMLIFFVFFGCRGFLDTDFVLYYSGYESAPTIWNTEGIAKFFSGFNDQYILKIEPGFKVFMILVKSISEEYYFLQLVSALIDILFLNYFLKKYSPQYVLGYIMFLIFSGLIIEFNLLRNSKAIFLFMYSLQFIKERNALKYFLCNGLGLLMHTSAIFYFPLYFFLHKKTPTPIVWGLFIVGNIIYLGQIKYITPMVTAIGNLLGGAYSLMAEFYSEDKLYSSGYGITMGYLEKVLTFLLFYASFKKIGEFIKDEKMHNIFFNLFLIFTATYLFLSEYSVLIDRMTTLFVMSYWILYPYFYVVLQKIFKTVFSVILFLFGIYKMVNSNNNILRKYENILWDNPSSTKAFYIINKNIDKILNPKKR